MPFFNDAVTFITASLDSDGGTCALLLDDEEARVSISHTIRLMPKYLEVRRMASTYVRHLQVLGFCDGLPKAFQDELVEMCKDFRRHTGFEDDDTFIELAQAFNAVGRLAFPERREHHFRHRFAIACPPTDEQIAWATKNVEHEEFPALMYSRKADMEHHGDPSNRIRIFPPNQPNSTGRRIYEYLLLNGPCKMSELVHNFGGEPEAVRNKITSLYSSGWLRRVDRATYAVVKYHDELPLPLSVRKQDASAERGRERNHSRQQTYERKKRRSKERAQQRRRQEERLRKEEEARLEDNLRG